MMSLKKECLLMYDSLLTRISSNNLKTAKANVVVTKEAIYSFVKKNCIIYSAY